SRHNIPPQATGEDGASGVLQLADPVSGATMAPSELAAATASPERTKRPTPSYGDGPPRPATEPARPDTRYSVTRAGVRDQVADVEKQPVAPRSSPEIRFDEGTSPTINRTQPLGRMRGDVTTGPNKTVLGVPSGSTDVDIELGSAGH